MSELRTPAKLHRRFVSSRHEREWFRTFIGQINNVKVAA
jgi:hypothetical protein